MVDVDENAPLTSLFSRGVLATIIVAIGDVETIISFIVFSVWFFYGLSFLSLIILKIKARRAGADDSEAFTVPIVLPAVMILISMYITILPIVTAPQWPYLYSVIFIVSGLIFYFPFVYCKVSVSCFDRVTLWGQLLFRISLPGKDI